MRRWKAAETRAKVIDAARRMFLERGYAGATIPRIAAEAGVAVETVYRCAAGKAGLLAAAIEAALAGGVDRAEVPVEHRPGIRRVIDEPDPVRQLELYAATQPGLYHRAGSLLRVLDEAAAGNADLAQLREQHAARRLEGMRRFAGLLAERGALRTGLSVERAADILVTVCAQANYDSLVSGRGWSHDAYRDWVADTLAHSLLAD